MRRFREILPATLALCLLWSAAVSAAELPLDYPLSAAFEDAVAPGDLKSFSAETLDGDSFTEKNLKDYDLTMVNIWATWCPPCVAEMPDLSAFQKRVPGSIQVITYCIDGDEAAIRSILEESGYEGITLRSVDGDFRKIESQIMYIPTTLFFDREGRGVGAGVIGGQKDFAATYTAVINSLLRSMGKPEMDLRAEDETETETEPGPEIEKETETED